MPRGTMRPAQIVRRIDQRHVTEGLRKIADLPLRAEIILFGQQSDVVSERQQTLEYLARFRVASCEREIVCVPEGAGEKGALARRQSIDTGAGGVTLHQAVVK